mgnify:CR=1 FL=1
MRIPMVDLAGQYRELKPTLEPMMAATLDAAQYILGPNVQAFEKEAAAYLGVKHAITCANGTDALALALRGLGVGPGDAVATVSDSEKTALKDLLEAKPEKKSPLQNLLAGRTQVKEWKVNDLAPNLAKALRGGKMQDVIFEGADTRKPAQLCEVALLLTECEQQLGSEYHEIEIMRRVHRDGQSEYFFNGQPCRLKDIHKLFMDTGIGRTSYSIMAQGQIDQILSSKPEERRAVFEEAAGITKYKSQRREAMNKLALTEQNLARVADVIGEVGRQIGSLRRQAAKAMRYRRLAHRQRHLSLAWAGFNHAQFSATLAGLESTVAGLRSRAEARRAGLDSRQSVLDGRKARRTELGQRLVRTKPDKGVEAVILGTDVGEGLGDDRLRGGLLAPDQRGKLGGRTKDIAAGDRWVRSRRRLEQPRLQRRKRVYRLGNLPVEVGTNTAGGQSDQPEADAQRCGDEDLPCHESSFSTKSRACCTASLPRRVAHRHSSPTGYNPLHAIGSPSSPRHGGQSSRADQRNRRHQGQDHRYRRPPRSKNCA